MFSNDRFCSLLLQLSKVNLAHWTAIEEDFPCKRVRFFLYPVSLYQHDIMEDKSCWSLISITFTSVLLNTFVQEIVHESQTKAEEPLCAEISLNNSKADWLCPHLAFNLCCQPYVSVNLRHKKCFMSRAFYLLSSKCLEQWEECYAYTRVVIFIPQNWDYLLQGWTAACIYKRLFEDAKVPGTGKESYLVQSCS